MRTRTFFLILVLAVGLTALPGCRVLGPDDEPTLDTRPHRVRWAAHSDGTYSFRLLRGCFCVPSGAMRVTVVDGEVISAVREADNEPVPEEQLEWVESIEDLFDAIDRARTEGADRLEAAYAREGYPTRIFIDWIEGAVDDEMRYEVSAVDVG